VRDNHCLSTEKFKATPPAQVGIVHV